MKAIKFFFVFLAIFLGMKYSNAQNKVKSPGSTTDIFNEFPLRSLGTADTLFIEGGIGNIYLQAGSIDNSVYNWSIGSIEPDDFIVEFTYDQANNILGDGSNCALISCVCPAKDILRWKKTFQQCCTDRIVKPPNAARGERLWGVSSLEKDLQKIQV